MFVYRIKHWLKRISQCHICAAEMFTFVKWQNVHEKVNPILI